MLHENITYAKAINLAMKHAMEEDPNVFAFGIDLTDFKKTFGSGEGLEEQFGIRRYFGSPVSEAAATGIAIGAAFSTFWIKLFNWIKDLIVKIVKKNT